MSYVIVVDLGGTSGRVGAIDADDPTVVFDRVDFRVTQHSEESPGDFPTDYRNLSVAISSLIDAQDEGPAAICLALAGKVNDERTTLTAAGNLGHWVEQEFAVNLSKTFNVAVVVGNDAEAAARAEAYYGYGSDQDFWSLIWGTGFGGTQVKQVGAKSLFLPGEPGHQLVDPRSDVLCGCGQFGCLEAFVGGKGIANRFGQPAEELYDSRWDDVVGWLALGVQNLIAPQPVGIVVFSGGIACKQSHRLDQVQQILSDKLKIVDVPEIRLNTFGEYAGLIGGATFVNLIV